MRINLSRSIVAAATLIVAGVGLSACVSESYNPYPPRYGSYDRHDHRGDDRRGWVDRDGDGRRDWWEQRR